MTSGWTCPSCGVNYAPSVTRCDCSAKKPPEKEDEWIRRWKEELEKLPKLPIYVPPLPTWPDPNDIWRRPWPVTCISPKILCHDGRNWTTLEPE